MEATLAVGLALSVNDLFAAVSLMGYRFHCPQAQFPIL